MIFIDRLVSIGAESVFMCASAPDLFHAKSKQKKVCKGDFAMRFLSQVYTKARGSVGGITYTANQHHSLIARARTTPTDPGSQAQGVMRQAFSGAAVDWKALTDAQRQSWEDYAATLTYPNPMGPISMPGRQVMMGNIAWMRYLLARGESFTTSQKTAPVIPGFLSMDPLSIGDAGASSTGFTVNIGNPNAEDMLATIQLSRLFDGSRNTFHGKFLPASLDTVVVTSLSTGNIAVVIGTDDDVYFVKVRCIVDDGPKRISQEVTLRAVVTTSA